MTAVEKEDWDPSVQAMAPLPDAVKQLAENIKWTTDLGNAFLAQQNDVMDAVQRMRMKAKNAGNLKSTEQQKVETKDRGGSSQQQPSTMNRGSGGPDRIGNRSVPSGGGSRATCANVICHAETGCRRSHPGGCELRRARSYGDVRIGW
ncbi:DUF3300 domain-containing protein [Tunturiibacter gelidoferens]|uniref:DUF3300 domain-containing protein n=1 Tax=Tunturiibacter gelidiferens TaxID=3069689 RepID=A0AAU7Z4R6_9BACT